MHVCVCARAPCVSLCLSVCLPACVGPRVRARVRVRVGPRVLVSPKGDADLQRAKQLFASHLSAGARATDVAVTPSAAYAISTVASNTQLRPGDEVLVLEEHYASVLPWQHAATSAAATIVPVPRHAGVDATPALIGAITERTAVVTAAPCGWTDGAVVDLVAVGAACRAVGAALVLDATQWVGAMPLDLEAIKPDAVIVSVHKWLLGLYSFAFLWLAPKGSVGSTLESQAVDSGVPLEHHDRNRVGSGDWDNGGYFFTGGSRADLQSVGTKQESATGFPTRFVDGAARFDMGGRPNVVLLPPLIVGMEWLHEVGGSGRIGQTLRPLTCYVRAL